jgi:hypothetical protein
MVYLYIMKGFVLRVISIIIGLGMAFGTSLFAESMADHLFNGTGYFKAMPPGVTKIYETSEFSVTATISAQGLRNAVVAVPKPKGIFRILALGDSYTFGWGVEETDAWPQVLERQLKEKYPFVEVVNAGMPGAAPTHERYICRAYMKWFDVDAVILGVYTDDLYQATANTLSQGTMEKIIKNAWPILSRIGMPVVDLTMLDESTRFSPVRTIPIWKEYVTNTLKINPQTMIRIDPELRQDYVEGKINPAMIKWAMILPDYFTYILEDHYLRTTLGVLDDKLKKLKDRCTGDKPVIVVFIPGPSLISESYLQNKAKLGYDTNRALTTFDMDVHLLPIVKKNGFEYISPISFFRTDGCPNCYYPIDSHMTREGYYRIAEYIRNHMGSIEKHE